MTEKKTREGLRKLFETGAKPTGEHFSSFIESVLNISDDGIEKQAGADKPLRITAQGQKENLLDFGVDQSEYTWRINQKPDEKNPGFNLSNASGSKLFIESATGNVGIGTATPGAKLAVNGDLHVGSLITFGGGENKWQLNALGNEGGWKDANIMYHGDPAKKSFEEQQKDQGIFGFHGKDARTVKIVVDGELHVGGLIKFGGSEWQLDTGSWQGANIMYNGSDQQGIFGIHGANEKTIKLIVDGEVGIGTSSPNHQLHVNGEIRSSGITLSAGGSWWHRSSGDAAIISDNGEHKALMIVGADYGQGNGRWVKVWDTLTVYGTLTVVDGAKNFMIDHPLDPDHKYLVHSTLEGPEVAVFYRGEGELSNGQATVLLPEYFEALTRKENRTVLLTPKFEEDVPVSILAASEVKDGKFTVKMIDDRNPSQKFYWETKAVRADVAKLEVEQLKTSVK